MDIFINLLEDAETELGLGSHSSRDLKKMGDEIKERLYLISNAMEKLSKKDWSWTTGARDIYLHKSNIIEQAAIKECREAGIPDDWIHIVP
ncbi:MAG: hypothetical protein AABY01_01630 [Nanoarchaeota archaeon]